MIVLLATGGVACIFGILTILLQLCAPRSGAAVTTCLGGLGVHIGMLVSYTVYLCKYFTAAEGYCYMVGCYRSYGANSTYGSLPGTPAYWEVNAFDYWSSWTSEMKALYIFGCAIGVLFWLIALPCAFGSVAVAKRRTAAEAEAAAAVMNVDALVAKPGAAQQDQFYAGV
ncbi:sugar ABC transporter permease [Chlorella sorokiniana]|uniref:Sugar ABC transporter permease n=1 Tax=Chlorella sorokiniana TaxID=3076 RepID=A0A2P6TIM7_CHLSO|nr:sugar ABC transporter permease [Chlorella sorokiniana]|eukprot:PRW39101.1 sugar ABC transporter permease [Chlorella sorokiniana]